MRGPAHTVEILVKEVFHLTVHAHNYADAEDIAIACWEDNNLPSGVAHHSTWEVGDIWEMGD